MKRTTAEKVAEKLGFDGTNFEAFDDICDAHGAETEYKTCKSEHHSGEPVRHVFPDGSAIVEAVGEWAIEGDEPFSWRVR